MEKIKWFFRKLLKAVVWFFLIAFASCIGVASGIASYQKMLQDGEFDGLLTASERKASIETDGSYFSFECDLPVLTNLVYSYDGSINGIYQPAVFLDNTSFQFSSHGFDRYISLWGLDYSLAEKNELEVDLHDINNKWAVGLFCFFATNSEGEIYSNFPSSDYYYPYSCSIRYAGYDLYDLGAATFIIQIEERPFNGYSGSPIRYSIILDTSFAIDAYLVGSSGFVSETYAKTYLLGNNSNQSFFALYDDSYGTGYHDGYNAGENVGFENGYDQGYDVGFSNGSSQVEPGELNGSIKSFVFTLFDAPVSTFLNVFDFQFEGFDFLGVVRLILSFAVIAGIVKLVV